MFSLTIFLVSSPTRVLLSIYRPQSCRSTPRPETKTCCIDAIARPDGFLCFYGQYAANTLCHPEVAHEPGEEDLSPEERRVLERKMKKILKKEKKRLKEEEESLKVKASGATASQQALDYLTCWAENHTEWKFQKTRQTWLLQHIFDFEKIPDDKFSVMLQYLEGLRGGARETTVQKALALIEESGQTPEDRSAQQRAQRAREVIQLLS
uniref:Zmp:0000000624 n=1 Tax=Takifugu rubripes TaxID=31033 RepID=A0A3B5KHU3_TAKRU